MKHNNYNISLEQHIEDFENFNTVSVEGIQDFFKGVVNITNGVFKFFKPEERSQFYLDAINGNRSALKIAKTLTGAEFPSVSILVPEGFNKGVLWNLSDDLALAYNGVSDDLVNVIGKAITDLGSTVNSSTEANITTPLSFIPAMKLKNKREVFQKKISSYFNHTQASQNMKLIDLVSSSTQLEQLHKSIEGLEGALKTHGPSKLNSLTDRLNNVVEQYLSKTEDMTGSIKTNRSAKELAEALYEIAKSLEFCGYIQTYSMQIYKTVDSINKAFN